jgi:hypothetical protein
MRNALPPLAAVVAILISGLFAMGLRPHTEAPSSLEGIDAHETHAGASLLGQFRTSVSSWLWLRTDLYLHNGVLMRPMTEWELEQGRETHKAADDGHEELHNEEAVTTVIPAREYDFRGVFGDIERAVAAYKDMRGHDHNDPKAALPLFRLMTWIDPEFIPGWTTGGIIIARDRDEASTRKALDYLLQGLEKNPTSIDILTQLGYLEVARRKDLVRAVDYLEQARSAAKRKGTRLGESETEVLLDTYRWLAMCYRDLGRHQERIRAASEGLLLYPDDGPLTRLSRPEASSGDEINHRHDDDCDHGH